MISAVLLQAGAGEPPHWVMELACVTLVGILGWLIRAAVSRNEKDIDAIKNQNADQGRSIQDLKVENERLKGLVLACQASVNQALEALDGKADDRIFEERTANIRIEMQSISFALGRKVSQREFAAVTGSHSTPQLGEGEPVEEGPMRARLPSTRRGPGE